VSDRIPWLVPPRLRTVAEDSERHASWLELFFDLVFVVAITVLSHELVEDHSAGGFLRFAALFAPVYVAWQGFSIDADRFDSDDLVLRLAFFGAMAAIALETAGSEWRRQSALAALLAFAAVTALWWIYFDRLAGVVLRVASPSIPIIYSYAHLPLLMALGAMSAGMRLLIEHAGEGHVGFGGAVALFGGVAVFLVSLIGTRAVTVTGTLRLGMMLKLFTVVALIGLLAAEPLLTPVALAGALALRLWALVVAERRLIPRSRVD
jgi:low temperature requirement protein LtrA